MYCTTDLRQSVNKLKKEKKLVYRGQCLRCVESVNCCLLHENVGRSCCTNLADAESQFKTEQASPLDKKPRRPMFRCTLNCVLALVLSSV